MFTELSNQELMSVDGGIDWNAIKTGLAIVALGVAIAATAGLATVPIAVIVGAGTVGEIVVAGAAVTAAATGGATIGYGLSH